MEENPGPEYFATWMRQIVAPGAIVLYQNRTNLYFLAIVKSKNNLLICWKTFARRAELPEINAGDEFGFSSNVDMIDEIYRIRPNRKILRHQFSAFGLGNDAREVPVVSGDKIECQLRAYMRRQFTVWLRLAELGPERICVTIDGVPEDDEYTAN